MSAGDAMDGFASGTRVVRGGWLGLRRDLRWRPIRMPDHVGSFLCPANSWRNALISSLTKSQNVRTRGVRRISR